MDRKYVPPVPKRSTLAAQKRQYKKLITPFRSPLLPRGAERCNSVGPAPRMDLGQKTEEVMASPICKEQPQFRSPPGQQRDLSKARIRTPRAAAQFKSPVVQSNATAFKDRASIRLTPTVQMLEHKLQLVRGAVKVKEDNGEEVLEQLVKKWTTAGREVAYELWDLIKDASEVQSKPPSFWNCNTTAAFSDTNWGWDKSADEESGGQYPNELIAQENDTMVCEEDEFRNTMGTMLRQLRIDPEILGWDDETESFVY
ncbi:hypothetical protein V8B97DRAFT_1926409 [Scleroderma yunnanense]